MEEGHEIYAGITDEVDINHSVTRMVSPFCLRRPSRHIAYYEESP
jgi:hypothetical protein